jgi:YidC/Oxa1 family membrane protein insertase
MEQARILIAIVLSFLVFLGWELFFTEKKPVVQKPQEIVASESSGDNSNSALNENKPPVQNAFSEQNADTPVKPARTITVDTPLYQVKVSEQGAVLTSFLLKHYKENIHLDSPFLQMVDQNLDGGSVQVSFVKNNVPNGKSPYFVTGKKDDYISVLATPEELTFVSHSQPGIIVEKRFTFRPDTYLVDLSVTVKNESDHAYEDNLVISLPAKLPKKDAASYGFVGPAAYIDNHLEQVKIKKIKDKNLYTGKVDWIAYLDRYFISAVVPESQNNTMMRLLPEGESVLVSQYLQPMTVFQPGSSKTFSYSLYFGPKSASILKSLNRGLEKAVNFGWFDIVAKPCLWLMNKIHGVIPNYGVTIILLTILIKVLLWPLGTKSYKSMNEMKKIQPLMAEIREKYKNDKKTMNEEVMGLYRTYKINPMGGCLPMIVQIPVFIALYRMLYEAIELRHAPFFGWINDLSAPDRLLRFDFAIPFMQAPYGIPVLTLIMGATMFLQQKMSPPMGDPAQAKMMLMMPVIFTFIFINFSSGLVLYWLVSNVLSILQQYYIQKRFA